MEKVYAVTVGFICKGKPIKSSYTVAEAPFDSEDEAARQVDIVLADLLDSYKCFETEQEKIDIQAVSPTDKRLVKIVDDAVIPLVQCSVLGVDMQANLSVCSTGIPVGCKHGTEEQSDLRKKMRQINRYIALTAPGDIL